MDIQIADVIASFLKGEKITPYEIEMLDGWVAESEENRKIFAGLCEEENYELWVKEYREIDADRAFRLVDDRIRLSRSRRFRMYSGIAAAVVCLLTVASVFLFVGVEDKPQEVASLIAGGTSKAWLTLENGEKIMLEHVDTLLQQTKNAVTIKSSGQIHYRPRTDSVIPVIEYNTLETPRGGEFLLFLPDGSEVWLNAESRLKFPVSFDGKQREVELAGEAYFKVVRDSDRPFIVKTSRSEITVLGTEFCIRDYLDEPNRTTLVKGAVRVSGFKGEACILQPNEQAKIEDGEIRVSEVEPFYFTAWKDGYFIFHEATLETIMAELAKWYDFEYCFADSRSARVVLSARLQKHENIEVVLDILSRTDEVRFTQKEKTIIVWENKK